MASADSEFRCFVRGLDRKTDENDLKKAFSKFGNIIDSKIMYDSMPGSSRRCGFVSFDDEKSMRDAIKGMHGKNLTGFVCFVHRLDCDTDAKRLASAFCMFGEVTDCEVVYNTKTGKSRGHGFVTFKEESSMIDAVLMMEGREFDGSYIHVEESHRNKGVSRFLTVVEAPSGKPCPIEASSSLANFI